MPRISTVIVLLAHLFWATAPASALAAAQPSVKTQAAPPVERLTFGPTLDFYAHLDAQAANDFVRAQLAPENLPQPEMLTRYLAGLPLCAAGPVELFRFQSKAIEPDAADAVVREAGVQALAARLARAALSPRQLQEVMTGFWLAFFLPDTGKSLARLWCGAFEREAASPFALGRFEDLLSAALRHPAMLVAYDNWLNSAPNGPGIKDAPGALNPTLAKAALKDMSLGQAQPKDVAALALILTGWGLGAPREPGDENGVSFDARRHAGGPKNFLGSEILDLGRAELPWAVARLAASAATAKFVSSKLAAYFLRGTPAAALVEKMTAAYRAHDGSIREVLAVLFQSREFLQSAQAARPYKSDFELAVAVARLIGPENIDYSKLAQALAQMGAPLFGREADQPGAASPSKQNLAARKRLVEEFCRGEFSSQKASPPALPSAEAILAALPGRFSPAALHKFKSVAEPARTCAILSSDEFLTK